MNVETLSRVMDVAAGPLVWTLDVANQPAIQQRLASSQIKLFACDMSPALFPPKEVLEKYNICTFIHDVTQPFPAELRGTFDLINMRLLVLGLNKEGWDNALRNLWDLLST